MPTTPAFTTGHCGFAPARPIPSLHELRSMGKSHHRGRDIHAIYCTKAEHRWVCQQLALRRFVQAAGRSGKALHHRKSK